MNETELLKKIIKDKSRNVINDKKAQDILQVIKRKYPAENISKTLETISKYSELPSWLNSALTINETFFFRHPEHFCQLEKWILNNKENILQPRALCVGVSSGEEAYSISFLFEEFGSDNYEVHGVDLSCDAIAKAEQGIYHDNLIKRASDKYTHLIKKYMSQLPGKDKDLWQVNKTIREHLRFKVLNIFSMPIENYDIIFVRNILIYFEPEDRLKIVAKLIEKLNRNGILFIGGGELLPGKMDKIEAVEGTSIWQKKVA